MHTWYVALDLDRTLFDTDRFADRLARISAALLGVSYVSFVAGMEQYKVGQASGLQYYDYFAHMAAMGKPVEGKVYDAIVRDVQTTQNSYLYEEVAEVLEILQHKKLRVFILTFGEPRYQKLKYDISPLLHTLPCHITLQDKSEWLANHYKAPGQGVLVDDKNTYDTLPPNWHLCHIQREKGEYLDTARILQRLH
jgi:FMN phosphatase YigB (HAD superfamily)